MRIVFDSLKWLISFTIILSTILYRVESLNSVSPVCELSVIDNYKLYNYSLATPIPEFPHGVLSEDGFYKAAVNETVVWFQVGPIRMNCLIDEDPFFTTLLESGEGDINNHPMGSVSVHVQATQPQREKRKQKTARGVSFTVEEDTYLISSWLNISMDSIRGTDQSSTQMWSRIYDYYSTLKTPNCQERSIPSLTNRWSIIQKCVNKFCGCLAQVERMHPSGATEQDKLCDGMIFNHDLPKCVDCWDCGGPSRCGMDCSALVVNNRGGYHVCTTIGHASSTDIKIIDKKNPHAGVIVKMSSTGAELNCSLSVSVICDSKAFQGPNSLEKLGTCDYATMMRHPSGCAKIVQFHGKGWGWFGTFITIVLCIFGGYFLAGTIYRYFYLGVRGIDIIPNLDVWTSLPQRTRSSFASMVQKFRGPSQGHRSSYSRVNF